MSTQRDNNGYGLTGCDLSLIIVYCYPTYLYPAYLSSFRMEGGDVTAELVTALLPAS